MLNAIFWQLFPNYIPQLKTNGPSYNIYRLTNEVIINTRMLFAHSDSSNTFAPIYTVPLNTQNTGTTVTKARGPEESHARCIARLSVKRITPKPSQNKQLLGNSKHKRLSCHMSCTNTLWNHKQCANARKKSKMQRYWVEHWSICTGSAHLHL